MIKQFTIGLIIVCFGSIAGSLLAEEVSIATIAETNRALLSRIPPLEFQMTQDSDGNKATYVVRLDGANYYVSRTTEDGSIDIIYAYDGETYYVFDRTDGHLVIGKNSSGILSKASGALDVVPLLSVYAFLDLGPSDTSYPHILEYAQTIAAWGGVVEKQIGFDQIEDERGLAHSLNFEHLFGSETYQHKVLFDSTTLMPYGRISEGRESDFLWEMEVSEYVPLELKDSKDRFQFPTKAHSRLIKTSSGHPSRRVVPSDDVVTVDVSSINMPSSIPIEKFQIPTVEATTIYNNDTGLSIK